VTAVALACLSAFLFGAMSVGLRMGLQRRPDPELATVALVAGAFAAVLVAVAAEAPARGVHAGAAWPFLLSGLIHPGLGMALIVLAIHEAGASRTSVVLGAAPLAAVAIAIAVLGEPLRAPLLLGALLVVAGGVELARERGRPEHLRTRGLVLACGAALLFAIRDNLVRWLSETAAAPPPATAAAAALLGGLLLLLLVLGPRVRRRVTAAGVLPFFAVGAIMGLSYIALFEAYYRGNVTVVSPLVATESLWGVALAYVFIRHTELVGRRVVTGAFFVVAGGVLIGIYAG
jgi:drug/metabolite transporter (DMT)-like permease